MKDTLRGLLFSTLLCSALTAQVNTAVTDGRGITWTIDYPVTAVFGTDWGVYDTGGVWVKVPTGATTVRVLSVNPAPAIQRSGPLPTDPIVRVRNGTMRNVLGPAQLSLGGATTVAQRDANVRKSAYDTRVAGKWSPLSANIGNPDPYASPGNAAYMNHLWFEPQLVMEYPIDLVAKDCLVSTISNPEVEHAQWIPDDGDRTWETVATLGTGGGPALGGSPTKDASVLLCLPTTEVVPVGAFRPAYAGSPATRFGVAPHFSYSQIAANTSNFTSLKLLAVPHVWPNDLLNPFDLPRASFLVDQTITTTNTTLHAGLERFFRNVWLDHVGSEWAEDKTNPTDHQPGYGVSAVGPISAAAIALLETDHVSPHGATFDRNPSRREGLLKGFVQVGIDSYGVVRGSTPYNASNPGPAIARLTGGGGKGGGRLWPILFAGTVLQEPGMLHPPRWTEGDASAQPVETFKEDWMFHRAPRAPGPTVVLRNDWQGSFWRWRGSDGDPLNPTVNGHQTSEPFSTPFYPLNNSGVSTPNYPTSGGVTLPPPPQWQWWSPGGCSVSYPNGQVWTTEQARVEQYRFSSSQAFVGIALAARSLNAFDLLNDSKSWPERDGLVGYIDRWMTPISRQAMVVLDYLSVLDPCQLFRSHRPQSYEDPPLSGIWYPPLPAPPFRNDAQSCATTVAIDYRDASYAARMYFEHRWHLSRPGFTVLPANYRPGLAVEGTACIVGGNPVAVCEQPCLTCVRKPVLTCQDRLAMEIQRDPAGNPIMSGGSPVMGPPVLNLEVFDLPPGAPLVAYVAGVPGTLPVPLPNSPVLFIDPASAVSILGVANNYGYCNLPMALPPPGFTVPYVVQGLGMLVATEYDGPPNYNYFGAATNALQFVW